MFEPLPEISLALVAVTFASVTLLLLRRIQLARRARRGAVLEERMVPLALQLVDGSSDRSHSGLQRRELEALAEVLTRYASLLTGEARRRIASYFERAGLVEKEITALRSWRSWRRAYAAYLLGETASGIAVPALLQALGDRSRDVRGAAARSLGKLRAVDAVPELTSVMSRSAVPRVVAGDALLAIGPPALGPLRELMVADEAETRATATELVGRLGHAEDAVALAARLEDSSSEVRARAARALGRVGGASEVARLRTALQDPDPSVRAAAASSLGSIGDAESALVLEEIARSDQFTPARYAARALARVSPEKAHAAAQEPNSSAHLREAADRLALGL